MKRTSKTQKCFNVALFGFCICSILYLVFDTFYKPNIFGIKWNFLFRDNTGDHDDGVVMRDDSGSELLVTTRRN